MLKKRIAMLGIILFTASLFPLKALAIGVTDPHQPPNYSWTKQKDSKDQKKKPASSAKPKKRKA